MRNLKPWTQPAVLIPLLAGVLPLIAVHGAYLMNIFWGHVSACLPYWDGCVSISRAARSGPGIILFRGIMFPVVVLLVASWALVYQWLKLMHLPLQKAAKAMLLLGPIGALCLILYVSFLGLEGDIAGSMRRIGVNTYFGFTALSQLLLVYILWPRRTQPQFKNSQAAIISLSAVVGLLWMLGVGFSGKKLFISNPVFLDRIESIIEWIFALLMTLGFVAIAWVFKSTGFRLTTLRD